MGSDRRASAPRDIQNAVVPLRVIRDARGGLLALEEGADIPFPIRRVYFLFDPPPGTSRGYHAHRNLEQVMVCVTGRCRVVLDDGTTRVEHLLESPGQGVYVGPMVWRELHELAPGTVVAVLASTHHDEGDYIRDYAAFVARARS